MKDIHLIYYAEDDYDIEAMYDTVKIRTLMTQYDHLDEPIEEVYFAGFCGRRSDDGIPFLYCNCRQIWAYTMDDDKPYMILNAYGHILDFMGHANAIIFQKDQCMFDNDDYVDLEDFFPISEYKEII